MAQTKRLIGYLAKMNHVLIRFRTKLPDYSDVPYIKYDWEHSIYGNVKEELPRDAPDALRNLIILTHYVDEDLYRDILTGRSATGILHFIKTHIVWWFKIQVTTETATY